MTLLVPAMYATWPGWRTPRPTAPRQRPACCRWQHWRQCWQRPPGQACCYGDDLGVPAAGLELVAAETGCGARVGRDLAGQPAEQVVLGGQQPGRNRGAGWLLVGQAQEHREQVAAVDPLPGDPVQGAGAAALAQLVTAGVSPAVLPGDRRPGRLAVGRGGDECRDHPGQSDTPPALRGDRTAELADDCLDRRDPVLRRLLGRPGRRPACRIGRAGPGGDRARGGERHALQPGGPEIETDVDVRVLPRHLSGHADRGPASSASTVSPWLVAGSV